MSIRTIFVAAFVLAAAATLHAQNPFEPPREQAPEQAPGSEATTDPQVTPRAVWAAETLTRRAFGTGVIMRWSHRLQAGIAALVRSVRDDRHILALAPAFLLAVAFGAVHIAGPGHGKVFALSYFSGRHSSPRDGLLYAGIVSIVDSLSALVFVVLGYVVLAAVAPAFRVEAPRLLQIVSYAVIAILGVVHAIGHLLHRHAHDHRSTDRSTRAEIGVLALSVGLIPCPVSTILFVYGVANGVLPLMAIMVLGVSLGGFVTMTAIAMLVIKGRQAAVSRLSGRTASLVTSILEYASSFLIVAVSLLLLVASIG